MQNGSDLLWSDIVSEFDVASAAVQAALDAGATYADARVMQLSLIHI